MNKQFFTTALSFLIFLMTAMPCNASQQQNATSQVITPPDSCSDIDYQSAVVFATQLQAAVRKGDKKAVANMAYYPLNFYEEHYTLHGNLHRVKDNREFIKKYNKIINSYTKSLILATDPKNIFCNYHGAMIANGLVWFAGTSPMSFFEIHSYPGPPSWEKK